ncbi:UBX domain-containing protein 11-like isoform X1 [Schistocerca nitens]|uniref:UBX domain-containing protein 11-like isoform X1 n=2 Tax=Schistocerca nitens TaxID=7011 RepID=UPI0021182A4E|nr:UBX domain-containing protein 11-like isoform X1 [Schistocerca nitens]
MCHHLCMFQMSEMRGSCSHHKVAVGNSPSDAYCNITHLYNNPGLLSDIPAIELPADLIPVIMRRLGEAERKVVRLSKELANAENSVKERDKQILHLNEKLTDLQKSKEVINISTKKSIHCKYQELLHRCQKAERQVYEMESFLADYGLMWIGGESHKSPENIPEPDAQTNHEFDNHLKNPEINFDVLLHNLTELNLIAGAGETQISYTGAGAMFKAGDSIPLTIYSNGLVLSDGPFRPYSDINTKMFVQDIIDGYFPSELQNYYPDGVAFKVIDKHTVHYAEENMQWKPFCGTGYILGGKLQGRSSNYKTDTPKTSLDLKL